MSDELGYVWELETLEEQKAGEELERIAEEAIVYEEDWAQDYLVSLWDEDWEAIRAKLETDGSVWYVWWMDGVGEHLAQSRKRVGRAI